MINSTDITLLHPALQRAAIELIRRMNEKGCPATVTATYIDNEYQDKLYAQGRTAPGEIITNAGGGQSVHNYKLAFDIAAESKEPDSMSMNNAFLSVAEEIGNEMGLTWRENGFAPALHFEFTNGLTLDQLQSGRTVAKDIKLAWERFISTSGIIYNMEKVIQLDKKYWKNVFDGTLAVNPLILKIIINRLFGKGEAGDDICTDKVLNVIKPYTTILDYWHSVFIGNEKASPKALKELFYRLLCYTGR